MTFWYVQSYLSSSRITPHATATFATAAASRNMAVMRSQRFMSSIPQSAIGEALPQVRGCENKGNNELLPVTSEERVAVTLRAALTGERTTRQPYGGHRASHPLRLESRR